MKRHFSTLKDPYQERILFRRRIAIVVIMICVLTALLIARLAYLQIGQHRVYTTLAQQNLLSLLPADPNRGLIYDRNGVLLAENIAVFNLVVTASRVPDLATTLTQLQKIVAMTPDDIQQFNRQLKMHRPFAPIVLHTRLTEEEVAHFSVDQYRFPGVTIQAQMIRHYPQGDAFASVVGYVGRINAKELSEVDPSNYSATNFIGKTGIEKTYETQLHGTVGYQQAETDASGKVIRIVNYTAPVTGNNLYLTIDSKLQLAAEKILGSQPGAIVAINPQNGEVLAFISNPSYDPNLFVAGISKTDYADLQDSSENPLYNRALQGKFPPGSTVKPLLGLEGLASGTITPDYTIFDPGFFKLKNSSHIYHDDLRSGHGSVNIEKAIPVSCDTFFFTLATKLGIDRIDSILTQFGYGHPTGIDLEGEASGVVPSPDWKQKTQKKPWYPGDTVITGIGQGYTLVTPVQLAQAAATIAMRGTRIQPHVLLRSQLPDRSMVPFKFVQLTPVTADPKIWDLIVNAMEGVVRDPYGTAFRFFQNTNYSVAGKTGTAQVFSLKKNQTDKAWLLPENLRDNSLFIAFAPVDQPQIAIAVMLQHSITPAAVVARQVLDDYFASQGQKSN